MAGVWPVGEKSMLKDFYTAFSPTCFTLLSLWLTIIAINARYWVRSPLHEHQAYAVALYFAAPGTMSLLALIDSASTILWRIVFTAIAVLGIVGVFAFSPLDRRKPLQWFTGRDRLVNFAGILFYTAIVVLAWIPFQVLRYEGGLLTLLVLMGVYFAMRMLFTAGAPSSEDSDTPVTSPAANQHLPVDQGRGPAAATR